MRISFQYFVFNDFLNPKENLALNKSTWQQHPLSDSTTEVGSEKAVDGLFTDRGSGGQCTLSDRGHYTAEWRVDLGSVVSINHINIYYRTDNQGKSIFITFFSS